MMKDDLKPKVALAIAAHPDDLEFGVAGTIANWIQQGTEVYYLLATDGSKGSSDPKASRAELIKTRRAEQEEAAKILGVKKVFFLDYEDGTLEVTQDLKRDIVRVIRQVKPDVVLTMDPTFVYSSEYSFVNHSDHRAAGQAAMDAVYPFARDALSFPELLAEGFKPHKAKHLLLVNFEHHNYYVDISDTCDLKMKALAAHKSQVPDFKATEKMLRDHAKANGRKCGCQLAEGFMRIDLPD